MLSRICYPVSLTCFMLSSTAFKLSFYENDYCGGAFVGTWIGGEGQGCRTDFVGVAHGVVVESTDLVNDNALVHFYSSKDCTPGTEITETNSGCIGVENEVAGEYRSFNVFANLSLESAVNTKRNTEKRRPARRHVPQPRDSFEEQPSVTHGQTGTFDGTVYRWQQVHETGWIGILPEHWDDNIHVMDNSPLMDKDLPLELNYISDLAPRMTSVELWKSICQTSQDCYQTAKVGSTVIGDVIAPFTASAARVARARGQQLGAFMSNPYITQIISSTIAGTTSVQYIALVAGRLAGDAQTLASCVAETNDATSKLVDALLAVTSLQSAALSATSVAAATVKVLVNDAGDEVSAFTVSTITCVPMATVGGCGITTGFCSMTQTSSTWS